MADVSYMKVSDYLVPIYKAHKEVVERSVSKRRDGRYEFYRIPLATFSKLHDPKNEERAEITWFSHNPMIDDFMNRSQGLESNASFSVIMHLGRFILKDLFLQDGKPQNYYDKFFGLLAFMNLPNFYIGFKEGFIRRVRYLRITHELTKDTISETMSIDCFNEFSIVFTNKEMVPLQKNEHGTYVVKTIPVPEILEDTQKIYLITSVKNEISFIDQLPPDQKNQFHLILASIQPSLGLDD